MLSVVATKDQDGFYEWRLPENILIVGRQGDDGVVIYFNNDAKNEQTIRISKKVMAKAFNVYLYPPGSVLVDEGDGAKRLRYQTKMERFDEGQFDIPREDLT